MELLYTTQNKLVLGTCRVWSWKIVSAHHLHVCLLQQWYPHLTAVVGIGTQQAAMFVHRQIVIYNHLSTETVHIIRPIKNNHREKFLHISNGKTRLRQTGYMHHTNAKIFGLFAVEIAIQALDAYVSFATTTLDRWLAVHHHVNH